MTDQMTYEEVARFLLNVEKTRIGSRDGTGSYVPQTDHRLSVYAMLLGIEGKQVDSAEIAVARNRVGVHEAGIAAAYVMQQLARRKTMGRGSLLAQLSAAVRLNQSQSQSWAGQYSTRLRRRFDLS